MYVFAALGQPSLWVAQPVCAHLYSLFLRGRFGIAPLFFGIANFVPKHEMNTIQAPYTNNRIGNTEHF